MKKNSERSTAASEAEPRLGYTSGNQSDLKGKSASPSLPAAERRCRVVYLCAGCHSQHGPDTILTIGVTAPFRCDVCGIQCPADQAHPNWEGDVRATTSTYRGGLPRSTE